MNQASTQDKDSKRLLRLKNLQLKDVLDFKLPSQLYDDHLFYVNNGWKLHRARVVLRDLGEVGDWLCDDELSAMRSAAQREMRLQSNTYTITRSKNTAKGNPCKAGSGRKPTTTSLCKDVAGSKSLQASAASGKSADTSQPRAQNQLLPIIGSQPPCHAAPNVIQLSQKSAKDAESKNVLIAFQYNNTGRLLNDVSAMQAEVVRPLGGGSSAEEGLGLGPQKGSGARARRPAKHKKQAVVRPPPSQQLPHTASRRRQSASPTPAKLPIIMAQMRNSTKTLARSSGFNASEIAKATGVHLDAALASTLGNASQSSHAAALSTSIKQDPNGTLVGNSKTNSTSNTSSSAATQICSAAAAAAAADADMVGTGSKAVNFLQFAGFMQRYKNVKTQQEDLNEEVNDFDGVKRREQSKNDASVLINMNGLISSKSQGVFDGGETSAAAVGTAGGRGVAASAASAGAAASAGDSPPQSPHKQQLSANDNQVQVADAAGPQPARTLARVGVGAGKGSTGTIACEKWEFDLLGR